MSGRRSGLARAELGRSYRHVEGARSDADRQTAAHTHASGIDIDVATVVTVREENARRVAIRVPNHHWHVPDPDAAVRMSARVAELLRHAPAVSRMLHVAATRRAASHHHTAGMTTQRSVIERWLAAGDRGEVDAFDDLLHADVVVHAPAGLSTDSRDAEKQVWRDALAAMPDLRHAVQEVLVVGETEMARVEVTGTLVRDFAGVRGSGHTFKIDQAVVCHLRGGKVAEAWEIADIASLIDQGR